MLLPSLILSIFRTATSESLEFANKAHPNPL